MYAAETTIELTLLSRKLAIPSQTQSESLGQWWMLLKKEERYVHTHRWKAIHSENYWAHQALEIGAKVKSKKKTKRITKTNLNCLNWPIGGPYRLNLHTTVCVLFAVCVCGWESIFIYWDNLNRKKNIMLMHYITLNLIGPKQRRTFACCK